jgi:serine/threonine protein kinase/tetratricopeptide (TPR) repeat protein
LEQIADDDLHQSLAYIAAQRASEDDPLATRPPTTVGEPTSAGLRFRILRPHAEGGLGKVFVARDEELRREVALKEIKDRHADDLDKRLRFLLEAEITGGLEHPGIVPVYGLGQYADGRPFYAMRFIRGDSLQDAIARFHRADTPGRDEGERTLALRKLLGRFLDVCNAIAYAHARGVLHRDLKPGNIMLGKYGETLVVDWGLAKPLGRAEGAATGSMEGPLQPSSASGSNPTQMGSAIGTPTYMPPEQAAGRLDQLGPASDVYSLGATLYCLLTGVPPFEGKDVGAVLRQVQHGEFRRPRQVKPAVPAALEAVCLKAMALQPEDRYTSPRALSEDIEHWLADEPVSAWREPPRVRVARWRRRHKVLVTGTTVLLLTALVALTAGLILLGQKQAEVVQERNAAQKARDQVELINKFLVKDLLAAARPEEMGKDVLMRKVLDRAAKRVKGAFPDEPEVESAVRMAIGDTYYSLGLYQEAEPHLQRAVTLRREHLGSEQPDTLKAINSLGVLRVSQGKYDEAEQLLQKNLEDRHRISGPEDPDTLTSMANLYWCLEVQDKLDEAEPLFRKCLEARRRVLGSEHPDTLVSMSDWAWFLYRKGKLTEAEALNRQCLAIRRRTLGLEHPDTMFSLANLADCLSKERKLKEAEALYRECWEIRKRILDSDHPYTLHPMKSLAELLAERGEGREAEDLQRQRLEIIRRSRGAEDRDTLLAMGDLAFCLEEFDKLDEAEQLYRKILEIECRVLGIENDYTLVTMNDLGRLLQTRQKLKEAEQLLRRALEIRCRFSGSEHKETATLMLNLAVVLRDQDKWEETERLVTDAAKLRRRLLGPEHKDTLFALRLLANVLWDQGKLDRAGPLHRQVLQGYRRTLGPDHRDTLYAMENVATILRDEGKLDEAERAYQEVLPLLRKLPRADHSLLASTLTGLGLVKTARQKANEAEPLLREALEIRQKTQPKGHWRTANTESALGECLTVQGRYAEAEQLLLGSYQSLNTVPRVPPDFVRKALDRIVNLYVAWKKPKEADTWRAKRQRGPQTKQ